jgi:hypothetical protein
MTQFDTSDRDVNRAIRSWLHEDRHEDASRIAGAVLDQIETTPQRRGTWWPARRFSDMNKFVSIGLGAAAVVVVAVLGVQLLGAPSPGAGVAPTASPSATPSPTAVPSVASPSASADLSLAVGSSFVFIDEGGVRGTVTVPAPGWTGEGGIMMKDESGADPPDGAGLITFLGDLYVYGDPCEWSTTRPDSPATTVDELVVALSAQVSRDASAPVDVTVGGYAGQSITLHVPDDAVFSECDEGTFGSWGMAGSDQSPFRFHQGPGQIDELWILDVDGVLTVIDTAYYADTPIEHVDEMRAIVESATFE